MEISDVLGAPKPRNWGGRPRKFDTQSRPDPEKQNPNQPRRQPILNFTLKIPENPKTQGERPRTRPDPEKQTPNPTRPRLLLPEYITILKGARWKKIQNYLFFSQKSFWSSTPGAEDNNFVRQFLF